MRGRRRTALDTGRAEEETSLSHLCADAGTLHCVDGKALCITTMLRLLGTTVLLLYIVSSQCAMALRRLSRHAPPRTPHRLLRVTTPTHELWEDRRLTPHWVRAACPPEP
ncbi:hypothetical protein V5799_001261 [Amblyomma americanum]|uniref:Uncharacterized protein n=1 Tax=Amblyomma americanum TaxID=6943 RepID=A0AAQ4D0P5_AMBAM